MRVFSNIVATWRSLKGRLRPFLGKWAFAATSFLAMSVSVTAQAQPPSDIAYLNADQSGAAVAIPEDAGVGGMGVFGRIGHEAGDTVGREGSLTFFDASPYMFYEETMFFGEGRFFVHNNHRTGGSAGLGMRHFFMGPNAIGGVSFFYDRDDHRQALFEQWGVSGEIMTEWFDFRMNWYLPFGPTSQKLGTVFEPGTERFVGNNIAFQTRTTTATALEGGEFLFTVPILGEGIESLNPELTAGFYNYQARGMDIEQVWGWKLRGDVDVADKLGHGFVELTNDGTYGTNVLFGFDINYRPRVDNRPRSGTSQYNRIAQWVRRNRTVVTVQDSILDPEQLAVNPDTGSPYLVYHVRNVLSPPPPNFPAPAGDGSIDMPFQFIQEGIDAAPFADIVFVHADSVYDGDLIAAADAQAVLRDGVLVLGEGAPLTIPVVGLSDEIPLPRATTGTARPEIRDVVGPAVTLADNSRFAGFNLFNINTSPAILGMNITDAELNEINISGTTGAGAHGISFENVGGRINLENINIDGTAGNALNVVGGNANIVFEGTNTITNDTGFSVFVEDARGSVNLRGTTVTGSGQGVRIQGTTPGLSTANVTLDTVTLTNTNTGLGLPGIGVFNHSGIASFSGPVIIDGNDGPAIQIAGLQPTGSVGFQAPVTINNRNDFGVLIQNIAEGPDPFNPGMRRAGFISFNDTLTITAPVGGTQAALSFQSASGTLNLQDTNINGSGGLGVDISNIADTGTQMGVFNSFGNMTISNTNGIAFRVSQVAKQNFRIITNGMDINARNGLAILFDRYAGFANLGGSILIDNPFGAVGPVVEVVNNTGDIGFGNLNITEAVGLVPIFNKITNPRDAAVLVTDNINLAQRSDITFQQLNVEGDLIMGALFRDNDNVATAGGDITITNDRGITVCDNTLHDIFLNGVNATNADFGIRVDNSLGRFIIGGTADQLGSGGVITGMTIAGASFEDTQVVDLSFMELTDNGRGVEGLNLITEINNIQPSMSLSFMEITDSIGLGVFALNVPDFFMTDSVLTDNGATTAITNEGNQLEYQAEFTDFDVDGDGVEDIIDYQVVIQRSEFNDAANNILGTHSIEILTDNEAEINGARLDLFLQDNGNPATGIGGFNFDRDGGAGVGVFWTGEVFASIERNTFNMATTDDQTALLMEVDGTGDIVYSSNTISADGDFNTGLNFIFEDSAAIEVSDNFLVDINGVRQAGTGFMMTGFAPIAMNFELNGPFNNVFIENNEINFDGGIQDTNAIGVQFDFIGTPSSVTINGNNMIFPNGFLFNQVERGIVFRNTGLGVLSLFGDTDNIINLPNNLDFDMFFNANVNGTVIVNGQPRP